MTLEEETFVRGKEMMKALIPAVQSLQISVKFGIKLLAQTAALYWSVEHMFCNFDVGIYLPCSHFTLHRLVLHFLHASF